MDNAGPLPAIPLTVLTHGKDSRWSKSPILKLGPELRAELAAQLPDSSHVLASKSSNFVRDDQPELVVDAIRDVLARLKAK